MSTLVIGDLHGCGDELGALLDVARRERADARVILVGDLFTKGPKPVLVVDLIAQHRAEGRRMELVCGNHDIRLLEALRKRDAGASLDALGASEAHAIRLLDRAGRLIGARRLLAEALNNICVRGQGWNVLHGGVVMTMLDVGMASAARSVQPEMGVLTIEMKTSFMRATPGDGSTLTVKSTLLHRTGRMAFVEGRIYDTQGLLCAQATGTFKYAPRQTAEHSLATD